MTETSYNRISISECRYNTTQQVERGKNLLVGISPHGIVSDPTHPTEITEVYKGKQNNL